MDQRRFNAEDRVLRDNLGASRYRFMDMDTSEPYIAMAAKTENGKLYTLRIELDEFPNSVPKVYVCEMLKTRDGDLMDEVSASMHTLSSKNGWTQICHYGYSSWTPDISLYMVYIRCLLWLDIYQEHLKTGLPMDHYLNHAN